IAAYIIACIFLAACVFIPPDGNPVAFWVLFLITLPLGLVATVVSYLLGVLLFGPEGTSLRVFNSVVWVIAGGLQGAFWWSIVRGRQGLSR
ncbi:MAG TPA: hypothetical protein VF244_02990, partial [Acidimicrobiales bacterium]